MYVCMYVCMYVYTHTPNSGREGGSEIRNHSTSYNRRIDHACNDEAQTLYIYCFNLINILFQEFDRV